ncbi:MAG: C4-dicarboxylate ABC transporter substrate-binding protein [Chitinivibrionales bacterium]|nr:C4-dicarboxylate ABC transporter substrate-binding protein [Chitinivibrionales bacterium]MBD3397061.1 C4-dicarboxylate ABC transporter substrate-binding protein [Chitinivibrionales bacterium]
MILTARFRSAALAAAVIVAAACGQKIKLGSLAPSGSPWDNGLRRIAAEWSTLSGGKVTLKIYPGGIAGDEEDMVRKMRIGQLDAAAMTGVGMCRIYTGVLAIQLPLLVRTDDELYYVLDKMKPVFEKELLEKGFRVLIWSKVGWVHFFSKEPVVWPEDLKKQKQFMWAGDAEGVQAWREAGFHPVPLAVTDLMGALQSGMVEAFTVSPLSAASYQWFALAKNMCGMKWAPLIGGIVVSERTWKRIPEKLKPELLAAAGEIGKSLQSEIDEADAQALEVMKQHGLKVSTVPPEAVAKWKTAAEKGFAKLAGKSFDVTCYELVKKHLQEYRQANAQ